MYLLMQKSNRDYLLYGSFYPALDLVEICRLHVCHVFQNMHGIFPVVAYRRTVFVYRFFFFPCETIPFCSFIRQFLSCLLFWVRFYLIQCGLCTILSCFRFPKESHSHFYLSAYARHNRTGFLQFID